MYPVIFCKYVSPDGKRLGGGPAKVPLAGDVRCINAGKTPQQHGPNPRIQYGQQ